ncbi:MAG: glycoside hydrolase family 44 protein [Planctomycetota bacterium]
MLTRCCAMVLAALSAAVVYLPANAHAVQPGDPGPADVTFTINAAAAGTPISPLIYGVNGSLRPSGVQAVRLGGNRWTGYNWETNNSNAGADFFHYNDGFLVNRFPNPDSPPGEAVRPALQEMASLGGATGVTVPMAGYVSADDDQEVFPSQTAPSSRWHELVPRKQAIYPGQSLSLTPDRNDSYVFTDEFVNWVESNRQGGQQVNYFLDNEPSLWDNTHPYLYGSTAPTFADIGQRSIETASVIKDVAPDAKVLGGVTFGWSGMQTLQDAPDFLAQVADDGGRQLDKLQFNRWLLKTMAAEEQQQGRVLMDALDVHWYPEAQGDGVRITAGGEFNTSPAVVEARVQAPRSLWDPTYFEDSYITRDILRDYSGQGNDQGVELLNRVRDDIAELKPGTLISVSEYNYGGGSHISGAIAQADVLGIFGREGVWNASWWPIENETSAFYVEAGFEAFTDFDGAGGRFGDLSLPAETDDIAQSSVYASRSTTNPNELVIVAINRTGAPLDAALEITDERIYTTAEIYQLTDAGPALVDAGDAPLSAVNAFVYEMPAFSVSTIRLVADGLAGDFNGDGAVDAADFTVWRDADGPIEQFLLWRENFGAGVGSAAAAPEPSAALLFAIAAAPLCRGRRWLRRV